MCFRQIRLQPFEFVGRLGQQRGVVSSACSVKLDAIGVGRGHTLDTNLRQTPLTAVNCGDMFVLLDRFSSP